MSPLASEYVEKSSAKLDGIYETESHFVSPYPTFAICSSLLPEFEYCAFLKATPETISATFFKVPKFTKVPPVSRPLTAAASTDWRKRLRIFGMRSRRALVFSTWDSRVSSLSAMTFCSARGASGIWISSKCDGFRLLIFAPAESEEIRFLYSRECVNQAK